MKIPQAAIHLNKRYRHYVNAGYTAIPVNEVGEKYLCDVYTNGRFERKQLPKQNFLSGELILALEFDGVRYLSFDHPEYNGGLAILKNYDVIFWHGPIVDDVNTCYETKIEANFVTYNRQIFNAGNWYNNFELCKQEFKAMGMNLDRAKAHNYTKQELLQVLTSGKLKAWPDQNIAPVITPKQKIENEQLTLF